MTVTLDESAHGQALPPKKRLRPYLTFSLTTLYETGKPVSYTVGKYCFPQNHVSEDNPPEDLKIKAAAWGNGVFEKHKQSIRIKSGTSLGTLQGLETRKQARNKGSGALTSQRRLLSFRITTKGLKRAAKIALE